MSQETIEDLTEDEMLELHRSGEQTRDAVAHAILDELKKLKSDKTTFNTCIAGLSAAFKICTMVLVAQGKTAPEARQIILSLISAASTPGGNAESTMEELSHTLDASDRVIVVSKEGKMMSSASDRKVM